MGFLLYRRTGRNEAMQYFFVRKLSVVGKSGSLSTWLASKSAEATPFVWKLAGNALVAALAPDVDPDEHTVVIDMMPERLTVASLCHIMSLAGQSEADETVLVIALRELCISKIPDNGSDPRMAFVCDLSVKKPDLIETMGIIGGTRKGPYKWCSPKMNIGAAVFHPTGARI
jgi:hypothetical protein